VQRFLRASVAVVAAAFLCGALAAAPALAQAPVTGAIYVSPGGSDATGSGSRTAPYQTIGKALSVAPAGGTVIVEPGTYRASLSITRAVTLESDPTGGGAAGTVVDATGQENALVIQGPGAAGSVIEGLAFENALKAGVVVVKTSHVTIENSVVANNDQSCKGYKDCANPGSNNGIPPGVPGSNVPAGAQPMTPTNAIPCGTQDGEDCEALHLMAVTDSTIKGNTVENNLDGGIYLTDEIGPTSGNTISDNQVLNNQVDCGITLASHNPKSVANPAAGGVYDNTVSGNTVKHNGGAGILIATPLPGGAIYGNTVTGNTAENNGMPGIALKGHAPRQRLAGNVISGNTVSGNGPDDDAQAIFKGQQAGGVGIELFSVASPATGTVVQHNTVRNERYGLWMTPTFIGTTLAANTTDSTVAVPAYTATRPTGAPGAQLPKTGSGPLAPALGLVLAGCGALLLAWRRRAGAMR
jgi:LPXTG-motif cell wall-anchored protein